MNTIINKYLFNLITIDQYRKDFENKCNMVYDKYVLLRENTCDISYIYNIDDIINLLHVQDNTAKYMIENIRNVSIYRIETDIFIKYNIDEKENYKFVVDNKAPKLNIYKNGNLMHIYDLHAEFSPLNFIRIRHEYTVDRYVRLFFANMETRLGMIIVAYYYIITYIVDKLNAEEKDCIYKNTNIVMLEKIFKNYL